jgi:hypothetical protein
MFLDSWRIRIGAMGAGILLVATWMIWGGSFLPGSECKVLVEFGADPDTFAGMEIAVDGQVAGRLEQVGQATRTAVPVACGTHRVSIRSAGFDCRPIEVEAVTPGVSTFLLLDHGEMPGPNGRPSLTLHP